MMLRFPVAPMRKSLVAVVVAVASIAVFASAPAHAATPAPCVEPPPDPANTYDAQHTYGKLVRDYPFIQIASAALPSGVRKIADQTYLRYGVRCLKLDMYLPHSPAASPVVIFVHGGGWRAGFRSEFVPMAVRLAQQGYASVTISYRLSGEAPYPAAVYDVRAALRWVRENAARYRLDPQRMVLAGGSAGGQIASLAAVAGQKFDPEAGAVQAVINIDGLSDFTTELALKNEDDPKKNPSAAGAWFGGRYAEKPDLWREASPIQYVSADMPPILFINSAQPRFSAGRDDMVARMTALGVASKTVILPDTPHSFWLFDPWLQPTVDASLDFLNKLPAPVRHPNKN
jgi:acetyl esterase/lipase